MAILLHQGPGIRLRAGQIALFLSTLLFLPMIIFYWYSPADSILSALDSTPFEWSVPTHHEVPPIPPHCFDTPASDEQPRDTSRGLSPKDLLCREVDTNATGIPKIFHQSWKSTELPSKFERWSKTCRDQHPDWEWVLWTDDDNDELVRTYFPWLEQTYLELPGPIYRADFVRNLYMYMFGGVYADLDLECLRPTEEALAPYRIPIANNTNTATTKHPYNRPLAVFGRLGSDESWRHSIPNAWMASTPRHPLFMLPLESARSRIQRTKEFPYNIMPIGPSAEALTGPAALRESILRWKSTLMDFWAEVVVLPSDLIYPYSWKAPGQAVRVCNIMSEHFDEVECKKQLEVEEKGSLTLTYWSHTHSRSSSSQRHIDSVSHDK